MKTNYTMELIKAQAEALHDQAYEAGYNAAVTEITAQNKPTREGETAKMDKTGGVCSHGKERTTCFDCLNEENRALRSEIKRLSTMVAVLNIKELAQQARAQSRLYSDK